MARCIPSIDEMFKTIGPILAAMKQPVNETVQSTSMHSYIIRPPRKMRQNSSLSDDDEPPPLLKVGRRRRSNRAGVAKRAAIKRFLKENHIRSQINLRDLYHIHLLVIPHFHLSQHMYVLTLLHDQLLEHKLLIKKSASFFNSQELIQMNKEIGELLVRLEQMHMDMVPFLHLSESEILLKMHMHMLEQMHNTKQLYII